MPSRTDQLHSYQFMVQRVIAALVMRETDPARSPFRRVAGATLVSVLFAALGLGGAAAYGLIVPGGSGRWNTTDAVIEEKESGARFVYRKEDDKLHPVLNYSSALLIIGKSDVGTVRLSHNSLNGVPRGAVLGIPGAPDALPPRKQLNRGAWTICSYQTDGGKLRSVLQLAGGGGSGGTPLPEGDKARALLVTTSGGAQYFIYEHRRHLIRDPDVLLPRLVWVTPPVPVSSAFINALPAGADMARIAPTISDFGAKLAQPENGRVGQVYAVDRPGEHGGTNGSDLFIAGPDGLSSLTPLQAELLLADPLYRKKIKRTEATNLTRGELMAFGQRMPRFQPDAGEGALPDAPPGLAEVKSGAVCATVPGPDGASGVTTGVTIPDSAAAVATTSRSAAGTVLADRVDVPPGDGALVVAVGSDSDGSGAVSLVTDAGTRFAVPSDEVLSMLGYAGATPVRMPAELVSLIPAGRALDPKAARGAVPAT